MALVVDEKAALRRYFPPPFYQLRDGKGLAILLDAIGGELNTAAAEMGNMRAQFLLSTASGQWLQIHGVNVDIVRPSGFNMTDDRFRQLIEIITNSPKNVDLIFRRLIALFFGPTAQATGLVDAYSYRNHEIILEIDRNALIIASSRTLLGTAFLHKSPTNPYTGNPQQIWTGTLIADAPAGSTSATFTTLPLGIPSYGVAELGSSPSDPLYEQKLFVLSGSTMEFLSPTVQDHPASSNVQGPRTPDDYPNCYVYRPELAMSTIQTISAGASSVQVGAVPENLPTTGVVYLGDPTGTTFEAKGYTFSVILGVNTLTFQGTTAFPHVAGETAVLPDITRMIKTTLNQTISSGTNLGPSGEMVVANSADFPTQRAAIIIDNGGNHPEIVPFTSRKVGDNTKIIVDPSYTFSSSHSIGDRVNLMSRQTAPRTTGFDYAFFLNDTDALKNTFVNILRRVKVVGVKLVVVVK